MENKNVDFVLSGDCGGTNTRLSLWNIPKDGVIGSDRKTPGQLLFSKKYENEKYCSFIDICKIFLRESEIKCHPQVCVLACAGPILYNTVQFTNVASGWKIDGHHLEQELHIPIVKLINDFAAMGYGLLTLQSDEYHVLNDAPRHEDAPISTIGAGTGLGECYLTPSNGTYECYPCEGGHTDYAPVTDQEIRLLSFLKKKFKSETRISYERLISGIGLSNIYEFLCHENADTINPKIYEEWKNAGAQQGAIIGKNTDNDPMCLEAMNIFVNTYGREAGNAALKYLPRGGFYITGGLAPKNLKHFIEKSTFMNAFFDKGRVSNALKDIPVYLVLTEDLGERGAHYYSYQLLKQQKISKSNGNNQLMEQWKLCGFSLTLLTVGIFIGNYFRR